MKKRVYIICAVAAVAASCTKSSTTTSETTSLAATFSSSIEATRVVGTEWESGDRIGIIVMESGAAAEGYSYNNCYDVSFSDPSQGSFAPASVLDQIYFSVDESDYIDFYAYYPYSASVEASAQSYAIDVADQAEPPTIDFIEASTSDDGSGGYNKNSGTVPLSFTRNMAKITLALVAGDGLELSDISAITFEGFYTSATYDLAAGTFGALGGSEASFVPYQAGADVYSAILIPVNAASHLVHFATPHGEISIDLSDYILSKGLHLYFTVTVSQTAANFEQNMVNGWDDAEIADDTFETE